MQASLIKPESGTFDIQSTSSVGGPSDGRQQDRSPCRYFRTVCETLCDDVYRNDDVHRNDAFIASQTSLQFQLTIRQLGAGCDRIGRDHIDCDRI
jgi:hypothetical protein